MDLIKTKIPHIDEVDITYDRNSGILEVDGVQYPLNEDVGDMVCILLNELILLQDIIGLMNETSGHSGVA